MVPAHSASFLPESKNRFLICFCLIVLLSLTNTHTTLAQSTSSNHDLQNQLEKDFGTQSFVWLEPPGQEKIFALFNQDTTGSPQGAVLLIHGLYEHPNWSDVVAPLLSALPEHGWNTLSLQIPGLMNQNQDKPSETIFTESNAQLKTAINFLNNKAIKNIVMIGHGVGSILGAAYIVESNTSDIKAFIGISVPVDKQWGEKFFSPPYLEKLELPVLDLYGQRDHANVTQHAKQRTRAAQKSGATAFKKQTLDPFKQSGVAKSPLSTQPGFIAYRQIIIPGATHDFRGMEIILIKRIVGWLQRHASGARLTK